jgi:benzodiazapine receptor
MSRIDLRPDTLLRLEPSPASRRPLWLLAPFLFAVAAVAATGAAFAPGTWYASLTRPGWTPPNWIFPPVWSLLYLGIAIAGWLLWTTPNTRAGRVLWGLQLLLNGLWSWIFFGLHRVGLALLDLSALVATVAVLTVWAWRRSRIVAWLMAPYLAWLLYAKSLNAGILLLNP